MVCPRNLILTALLFILAVFAYGLGNDISGQFGWILWFAPLPILLYALNHSYTKAFCFAFLAFAIANIISLYYLSAHIPLPLRKYYATNVMALGELSDALVFALGILLTKWVVNKLHNCLAILFLPAYWTSYEYLTATFAASGNNGSMAFSQIHWLSLIQISSIAGIWAITFLLILVPSSFIIAWHFYKTAVSRLQVYLSCGIPVIILLVIVAWGNYRIAHTPINKSVKVALIATNENIHDLITTQPQQQQTVIKNYLQQVQQVAQQHAQIVLLPEKFMSATSEQIPTLLKLMSHAAHTNAVYLLAGINVVKPNGGRNAVYIFAPSGNLIATYYKQHLLAFGPEATYQAGNTPSIFSFDRHILGTATCHDLDFQALGRQYGKLAAQILFVPALDFVADGWQHGRNAIMQGVENGYSIVRNAQWGFLSISNSYGKIIALQPTSLKQPTYLIGEATYGHGGTLYSRYGDWFAWLCCILTIALLFC